MSWLSSGPYFNVSDIVVNEQMPMKHMTLASPSAELCRLITKCLHAIMVIMLNTENIQGLINISVLA